MSGDDRKLYLVTSVLKPGHSLQSVTDQISGRVLTPITSWRWWLGLGISFLLLMALLYATAFLFYRGIGIWGVNIPVAWGFAITNFVWWIGIGHAGTFISAFLLLLRQPWRTSINRFAEAMTIFAVACAGLFPILHLGRPWFFYWLLPYPDAQGLWPQFRSPLIWDVFAVLTYFTVSLLFWYVGLIPDFATLRDKASKRRTQKIFGVLAMGWRGSADHWHRYEMAYLLMAGLATPLVVSVHSIVSMDFAAGIVPGWHSTIFPPYFVAGAIFSGFAMVLTLLIPLRAVYGFQDFITHHHLNQCAKLILVTGWIVAYSYCIEAFISWYSGNPYEKYVLINRALGPYAWTYWILITCNILTPQFLWSRRIRINPLALWIVSLLINLGMWMERFVIVVVSLHRDFLPSAWGKYMPTRWDVATLVGSMGLFLFLFFLFIRLLPVISITEMRQLVDMKSKEPEGEGA